MPKIKAVCEKCGEVPLEECIYWELSTVVFHGRVRSEADLDSGIEYQIPLQTKAFEDSRLVYDENVGDSGWHHKPLPPNEIKDWGTHSVDIEVEDGE